MWYSTIGALTPPLGAAQVGQNRLALEKSVVETLSRRAEAHNHLLAKASETLRQEVRARVIDLLDSWQHIADREKPAILIMTFSCPRL